MNGATPGGPSVVMTRRTAASTAPWANTLRRENTSCARRGRACGTYWDPMPTAITSNTAKFTSGDGWVQPVNSRPNIANALANEVARKKTHPTQTSWKVANRCHATHPRPSR